MKKKLKSILMLLLLIGLSAGGYYFITHQSPPSTSEQAGATYVCPMHPHIVKDHEGTCPICGMNLVKKESKQSQKKQRGEKKLLYWVAPMDANYRRDKPGKSPMGMDLVAVYDEGNSMDDNEEGLPVISIKANTAQNMGIRTAIVKQHAFNRTIRTVGSVVYNEESLLHVHPRANGWVEKAYVKAMGDHVKKGDVLLDLYSPDIVAAQKDLIVAKKSGHLLSQKGSGSLVAAAKQRLRLLDVPNAVIEKIQRNGKAKNHVPILSSQEGVVVSMAIREGMYVTPSTEMYVVADLSTVWVIVDVFEHQYDWFSVGNKAEITVSGIPEKTWKGVVDYIYPELNKKTRTLNVRLKFTNSKQRLKPNMFADVTLYSAPKTALTVPSEAIIYDETGPRIIKVTGEHSYQPIPIKIGMKSRGRVEIIQGLKVDDKVVVSGQFMLDSESNLQASFRRLSE